MRLFEISCKHSVTAMTEMTGKEKKRHNLPVCQTAGKPHRKYSYDSEMNNRQSVVTHMAFTDRCSLMQEDYS